MTTAAATDLSQIDFDLPPQFTVLRRLIRVLGVPDTLTLLRARGGIPLKLPMKPGGILVEMFGIEKVKALLIEFGPGTIITLPMPDKIEARIRNVAIKAEHAAGETLANLAMRYRLTMRQVLNILKLPDASSRSAAKTSQSDLFS